MEYRKLIKFGKSSFVVSLPKEWLRKNKMKKGDLLYFNENNQGLSISSFNNEKKELKKIAIKTENKNLDRINTEIVSSYLNNYDEILIEGEEVKNNAVAIKNFLNILVGLEVIEQTRYKILAKNLLDGESISIKKIIRRIDMILRGMLDDSIDCIYEDNYESVFQRDLDVNRLVFLSQRILRASFDNTCLNMKEKQMDSFKIILLFELCIHLERIGDQTKRIARHTRKLKSSKKTKEQLHEIYKKARQLYLETMKSFYTDNKELAFGVDEKGIKLIDECNHFLKRYPGMKKAMIMDYLKRMISSTRQTAMAIINYDKPISQKKIDEFKQTRA